jgi:hypothetical protein
MTPEQLKRYTAVRGRILEAMQLELKKGEVSALELLAILAHTTGACIAYQDQRKVTRESALDLVAKNLEAGNTDAMFTLLNVGGTPQ